MNKQLQDPEEGCLPAIILLTILYSVVAGTAFILYSIFYS